MNTKIICIGGALIDKKLTTIHTLQVATSNPVSSTITFGGVAHNVALNLSRLTDNIHLQSIVGDDIPGRSLLTHLKNSNIDADKCLVSKDKATAHYYAVLDTQGELHIALAHMEIFDDIPFTQFSASWENWRKDDIVFLDANLPSELLEHAIHVARMKQIKLIIDPVSAPKAKKIPQNLNGVFLIKPDRLEAECLTGIKIDSIDDSLRAAQILLQKGVKNVVISLGQLGYVLANASYQQHSFVREIEGVVDVSGAGDAFIAGILYELKQGSSILDACKTGATAAAITLQSRQTVSEELTLANLKNQILVNNESDHATIF